VRAAPGPGSGKAADGRVAVRRMERSSRHRLPEPPYTVHRRTPHPCAAIAGVAPAFETMQGLFSVDRYRVNGKDSKGRGGQRKGAVETAGGFAFPYPPFCLPVFTRWAASHNGFFFESPHEHRVTRLRISISFPSDR
jgi:hypothetical protein